MTAVCSIVIAVLYLGLIAAIVTDIVIRAVRFYVWEVRLAQPTILQRTLDRVDAKLMSWVWELLEWYGKDAR